MTFGSGERSASHRREHARRFFLLGALRLHRELAAGNERKVMKIVAMTIPGQGEDDLQVVVAQPGAEPALQAEDENEDQAGDHRADRERQVDEGEQQVLLPRKSNLAIDQGGGNAEDEVGAGTEIAAAISSQPDRRESVGPSASAAR